MLVKFTAKSKMTSDWLSRALRNVASKDNKTDLLSRFDPARDYAEYAFKDGWAYRRSPAEILSSIENYDITESNGKYHHAIEYRTLDEIENDFDTWLLELIDEIQRNIKPLKKRKPKGKSKKQLKEQPKRAYVLKSQDNYMAGAKALSEIEINDIGRFRKNKIAPIGESRGDVVNWVYQSNTFFNPKDPEEFGKNNDFVEITELYSRKQNLYLENVKCLFKENCKSTLVFSFDLEGRNYTANLTRAKYNYPKAFLNLFCEATQNSEKWAFLVYFDDEEPRYSVVSRDLCDYLLKYNFAKVIESNDYSGILEYRQSNLP